MTTVTESQSFNDLFRKIFRAKGYIAVGDTTSVTEETVTNNVTL